MASDFQEMKELGANVVRIHLQFGRFMVSPDEPNREALLRLKRLVQLAEVHRLYLDVTGLGCYHKQDVPAWYDALDEGGRWTAQAVFWEAIAATCAASPAIFCYDLMNEPVSPGGKGRAKDWLGPVFGDKHFVQRISLDANERPRELIAKAWVDTLVRVIRKHDTKHLITVGMVDWSLDRPGLTSGFVPERVSENLDFIAVHLYHESGKLEEDLLTLKGFQIGKPVVIEEMFPLKCNSRDLRHFIQRSQDDATGWIGFYWGKTPVEYSARATVGEALTFQWLELFEAGPPQSFQE